MSALPADDHGRPSALAFHALFLSARDYRKAEANPFRFLALFRTDWTAETQALPSGIHALDGAVASAALGDSRVGMIATALMTGRKVAMKESAPIDALACAVWQRLPLATRKEVSLATWAFGNDNEFHLVAMPRLPVGANELPALQTDDTTTPRALARNPPLLRPKAAVRWVRFRPLALLCGALALAAAGMGIGRRGDPPKPIPRLTTVQVTPPPPPRNSSAYPADRVDFNERRRVCEGLVTLAEHFQTLGDPSVSDPNNPAALMAELAHRLRYRGPTLAQQELTRLREEKSGPDRERDLALAWHAKVAHFADDRPLPPEFPQGTLRWQLDTLLWSFHLDPQSAGDRKQAAELPHVLAEALAIDTPIPSISLFKAFPTLVAYREFLSRLPRK